MYVGAITEEKKLDLLINSFKKYLEGEHKYDATLLIAGEGNQQEALVNLTKTLGIEDKVIFVGKVVHDKLKSFFAITDVFVTASTSETQSISTMEAMAASTLVLVKDDETLIGLVDRDENGFVFNDDVDFAIELNHIFSLSEDEVDKVKKAALKTIKNNFNLETYYERVMEVYNRAKRKKW